MNSDDMIKLASATPGALFVAELEKNAAFIGELEKNAQFGKLLKGILGMARGAGKKAGGYLREGGPLSQKILQKSYGVRRFGERLGRKGYFESGVIPGKVMKASPLGKGAFVGPRQAISYAAPGKGITRKVSGPMGAIHRGAGKAITGAGEFMGRSLTSPGAAWKAFGRGVRRTALPAALIGGGAYGTKKFVGHMRTPAYNRMLKHRLEAGIMRPSQVPEAKLQQIYKYRRPMA